MYTSKLITHTPDLAAVISHQSLAAGTWGLPMNMLREERQGETSRRGEKERKYL